MAWTSPRTWAAAETVTAAIMNAHVRDNLKAMSEWTAYTPAWTATGGTPTIGNGSLTGNYAAYGAVLLLRINLTIGSTTNLGTTTAWQFGLPSGIAATDVFVGHARASDTSMFVSHSCSTSANAPMYVAPSGGGFIGYNNPFTWANTDTLSIAGIIPV